MSTTWRSDDLPQAGQIGPGGWLRVAVRLPVLGLLIFGGLGLLLALRLIERPLYAPRRPLTPYITQFVCRITLAVIGVRFQSSGLPMRVPGAVVANHAGWLDIFTLNAAQRICFVSKSEVAGWAGIGLLARATGTVFINRQGREARAQSALIEERLRQGHRLLFFPEGTSTDGLRVLPFKSTLFAAFFADGLDQGLSVQPVSVRYHAPEGADPRIYGWWGDMEFGPHFLQTLAAARQGSVRVQFHDPVPVARFADRKALATWCEATVRAGFERA